MASGKLASGELTANTWLPLYTCAEPIKYTSCTVYLVNRSGTDCFVDLAISEDDTVLADEYLEFQQVLVGRGTMERTGLVLGNTGQRIMVRSTNSLTSANCYGIEVIDPAEQGVNP